MSILTFPTLSRTPSNANFRLRGNTQTHRSPLTGATQTLEMPGAKWELTVSWESLTEVDWRILSAFLADLRGRAGRFFFPVAIFAPRRATPSGSPSFAATGDVGPVIAIGGWGSSVSNVVLAGDWFSYVDTGGRKRLHMVTADASSGVAGIATTSITPPIRVAGAKDDPIEFVNPVGVFMLTDDGAPETAVRPPRLGAISISMEEAII